MDDRESEFTPNKKEQCTEPMSIDHQRTESHVILFTF